jgi:hypothetical protein
MAEKPPRFEVVVSAENNPYMAWQAMLFHYSCVKHTGQAPLVVVHGDMSKRLRVEYQTLRRHGGRIQRAPNFRLHRGLDYAPRNTPATLRCVETDADYIVLCDPDMIFFGPARFDRCRPAEDQISLDRITFMTVNDESRRHLTAACERAGISVDRLARDGVGGGVPHIVPQSLKSALSREWLRSLDFFFPGRTAPRVKNQASELASPFWIASMWAIILAMHRLDLRPVMTDFALLNYRGDVTPVPPTGGNAFLIHYSYGDSVFDKRVFFGDAKTCKRIWKVRPAKATISGLICSEIAAAKRFFGL